MTATLPRRPRARNHALWLGPLIVFAGSVSYFTYFARFPVLRDFPWVNLPLVVAGLVVAAVGFRRSLRGAAGLARKILALASLGFSAGLASLFVVYLFYWSYQLPEPTTRTTTLDQAPDFRLRDQDGRWVELSGFRGRKVVLTFYRGYW